MDEEGVLGGPCRWPVAYLGSVLEGSGLNEIRFEWNQGAKWEVEVEEDEGGWGRR